MVVKKNVGLIDLSIDFNYIGYIFIFCKRKKRKKVVWCAADGWHSEF